MKKKCQYHTKLARLGVIQSQFQILFFPMDWVHRRLPRKLQEKKEKAKSRGQEYVSMDTREKSEDDDLP